MVGFASTAALREKKFSFCVASREEILVFSLFTGKNFPVSDSNRAKVLDIKALIGENFGF